MQVLYHGARDGVTGSCHQLIIDEHNSQLIDCGLFQGAETSAAGHVIGALEQRFQKLGAPVQFIKTHHEADGNFPNGILPENRAANADAVKAHEAGDGYRLRRRLRSLLPVRRERRIHRGLLHIVGQLVEAFLKKESGARIIDDPCLTWHTFIKERMRKENAIYGGEMSARHYFRDFGYCAAA